MTFEKVLTTSGDTIKSPNNYMKSDAKESASHAECYTSFLPVIIKVQGQPILRISRCYSQPLFGGLLPVVIG